MAQTDKYNDALFSRVVSEKRVLAPPSGFVSSMHTSLDELMATTKKTGFNTGFHIRFYFLKAMST